jgi:hypothetical protein
MESLGQSELVRTNNGLKVPENFNHDHFPNPYDYEWQNPQGLSEPDEAVSIHSKFPLLKSRANIVQHIVNTHVGDQVSELLFGSYPEAVIEKLDKCANSDNIFDVAVSGFYAKMRNDILNWYIKFREHER